MDQTTKKWLKGCGIGCGVFLFLAILGTVGGSLLMLGPFRDAVGTRQELDEKFGDQSAFIPACDGAIAPDRMKAFLDVRRALMAICSEFEETTQTMERLDELDDDASKKEIFQEFTHVSKAVLGMGLDIGKFFAARNKALLDNGMSRGEYTYIYTMAYLSRLQSDSYNFNSRAREVLRQILRNQLQQDTAGNECRDMPEQEYRDNQAALEAELSSLEYDHTRLPWQDGLPEAISLSLLSFQYELASVYCEYTVEYEFVQNRRKWFGIQGD